MTSHERDRRLATLFPDARRRAESVGRSPAPLTPARGGSYGAEAYGEAYDPHRRRWPDDANPPKRR